jgi:hypothetical protein
MAHKQGGSTLASAFGAAPQVGNKLRQRFGHVTEADREERGADSLPDEEGDSPRLADDGIFQIVTRRGRRGRRRCRERRGE